MKLYRVGEGSHEFHQIGVGLREGQPKCHVTLKKITTKICFCEKWKSSRHTGEALRRGYWTISQNVTWGREAGGGLKSDKKVSRINWMAPYHICFYKYKTFRYVSALFCLIMSHIWYMRCIFKIFISFLSNLWLICSWQVFHISQYFGYFYIARTKNNSK